jgi:arylsulfatase
MAERIDEFGTPEAYNHYAVGWAHAMDTPYQWTKQAASHWGGTRNGTIVHWPNGVDARGEVRHQFHHVIDVAPTVLEAAGLPEPTAVHGVTQKPYEGASMRNAFDDAQAAERHVTQYFEMFCNRGIYHEGWTAVTRHPTPWVPEAPGPFADDTWELYDTNTDRSQAHDLAADMPERLDELKALFIEEARRYNVPARRSPGRALQPRPRRATHADPRHLAAALRRYGTAHRERRPQSRTSRTRSPPR